jgi:hypothetical protein
MSDRFQRRPRGHSAEIGFEITGGFLTESGEQRRQICERAIDEAMRKMDKPFRLIPPIGYVPDYSRGFQDSIVKVELTVPVEVDSSGKAGFQVTVPAFQDWGDAVIRTVLAFTVDWASKQS